MKTIYIPKGETVHYESLSTDHLIVEGTLEVTYGVVAKQIDGDGVIHAGTVEADIIRIRCIETARTVCRRLIAKVVESSEVCLRERGGELLLLCGVCGDWPPDRYHQ